MRKMIILASMIFSSIAALAKPIVNGTKDGGGGPSIICSGPDGKVRSAQLLDLYEGQIRYGLAIAMAQDPATVQLKRAFDRIAAYDWFIAYDVENALRAVESKIAFLPPGVIMAPGVDLGDSYAALMPNGCGLAYAGYYESDGTLRVSQDIWNHLDETNRAALLMHEALYKVAREIGEQDNSLLSREFNAYLFSTSSDLIGLDEIAKQFTWCTDYSSTIGECANPVRLKGPADQDFTVTITNAQKIDLVAIECYFGSGQNHNIYLYKTGIMSTPNTPISFHYPIKQCTAIGLYFSDGTPTESPNLTVTYEGQVLYSDTPDLNPETSRSELSRRIPIYFDRQLAAPDKPLD